MFSELRYLSNADLQSLKISPREAREAVLAGLREMVAGRSVSAPKSVIGISRGHAFVSISVASENSGMAIMKWAAVAPLKEGSERAGINGRICVSDYRTGMPTAVLDGNFITLVRTAAVSAAAATSRRRRQQPSAAISHTSQSFVQLSGARHCGSGVD